MNNLIGFDAEPLDMVNGLVNPIYKKNSLKSSDSIDINSYGPPPIPSNTKFPRQQKPNYEKLSRKRVSLIPVSPWYIKAPTNKKHPTF